MSDFTDDGDERDEPAVEEPTRPSATVLGVTDDTDGPSTPAVVDPAPALARPR